MPTVTPTCRKRLLKESMALKKNPVENIQAVPYDKNILEWHYLITGPKDTPYEGGYYHGTLQFPHDYPFKPPSIIMHTRNGRFKTGMRLCLSMSDYHPESWNPMWSVSSILSGLLSFMLESGNTLGSIETTDDKKRQFAALSLEENLKNTKFCKLFPEVAQYAQKVKSEREQKLREQSAMEPQSTAPQISQKQNENDEISFAFIFIAILVGCIAMFGFYWT